jgi:hypothetical protein
MIQNPQKPPLKPRGVKEGMVRSAKCELRGRMFALSIIFVKEKENLPYFRVFDIASRGSQKYKIDF